MLWPPLLMMHVLSTRGLYQESTTGVFRNSALHGSYLGRLDLVQGVVVGADARVVHGGEAHHDRVPDAALHQPKP